MKVLSQADWDRYFLVLAKLTALRRSEDPSTKVGAVIALENRVITTGYNRFAPGVLRTPERVHNRDMKYRVTIHGEMDAILKVGASLLNHTLYTWPFLCCSRCAAMVIHAGFVRVVAPKPTNDLAERWGEDMVLARQQFSEARVRCEELDFER